MDKEARRDFILSFIIGYVLCAIMWPLMSWLWTFIDGSTFEFHFGRNMWIALGFGLLFAMINPKLTSNKRRKG